MVVSRGTDRKAIGDIPWNPCECVMMPNGVVTQTLGVPGPDPPWKVQYFFVVVVVSTPFVVWWLYDYLVVVEPFCSCFELVNFPVSLDIGWSIIFLKGINNCTSKAVGSPSTGTERQHIIILNIYYEYKAFVSYH